MESHRFDAGIYWQVLGSWPEDELQMSLIVLVMGLVTFAGSVGYVLIRRWSVLRFFSPAENSWKVLEPTLKIQRGLSQLQLHRVSIPDSDLFLNHSETILKSFLTHPHPVNLSWHSSNLQSVGRRFTVGLLGPRAGTRTATSRADRERGAFNLCRYTKDGQLEVRYNYCI